MHALSTQPLQIEPRAIGELKGARRNARKHSRKQIEQIAASIKAFGFNTPILIGDDDEVIAGHGRLAAARLLGYRQVPTIRLSHMTPAQRRAFAVADNRLAELASWDFGLLSEELIELGSLAPDLPLEITGFEGAELDRLLDPFGSAADADDVVPEPLGPSITRPGDTWELGEHRLYCGDARDPLAYQRLMQGDVARMMFADPPYNVPIDGHVGRRRKSKRADFAMGCGELDEAGFVAFLVETLGAATAHLMDGAISYVCMDWRHFAELLAAGREVFDEQKNLVVWSKANAGMGAFYRSAHELIGVFKTGTAAHTNTFGLGAGGRHRTNVWSYPGATSFGADSRAGLADHPTVKPVALVADAIKDVSRRGDVVLDPFGGSGTTLIAAQKTGRRARLLEIEPAFCDVICRRWMARTGIAPVRGAANLYLGKGA